MPPIELHTPRLIQNLAGEWRQGVYKFSLSSQSRLDIAEFERLLLQPPTDDATSATGLRQALASHRGSFMEGFTLDSCEVFEEWLTIQREHFHRRVPRPLDCWQGIASNREIWARPLSWYAGFYTAMLHTMEPKLKGAGQHRAFRTLTADGENIGMAWQWSAGHGCVEQLNLALDPLCRLYEWQGRGLDGETACDQVVNCLTAAPRSPAEQLLLARVYAWQSMFSRVMGHSIDAAIRQDQAVEMLDVLDRATDLLGKPAIVSRSR